MRAHVVGPVATRENAAMNVWMQRLDPAVHHFWKTGDVGHVRYAQARVGEGAGGAASGYELESAGGEPAADVDDTALVGDTQKGSWHTGRVPVLSSATPGGPGAVRERPHTRGLFFWSLIVPLNDATLRHST